MIEATEAAPRTAEHDQLEAFIGRWTSEGVNYAPDGSSSPWQGEETFGWLPGRYFVVQHWSANPEAPFLGLGVMGWSPVDKSYFVRSFENHGFFREYAVTKAGDVWTLSGETERARIVFEDDGASQRIQWEAKINGEWKMLCNRVAHRVD